MKTEVVVCDVCKDVSRPTVRYHITSSGREANPDLCTEHAEPLEALLPRRATAAPAPAKAPATKAPRKSAPAKATAHASARTPSFSGGRRNSTPIMTMEEIEAQKAARKA